MFESIFIDHKKNKDVGEILDCLNFYAKEMQDINRRVSKIVAETKRLNDMLAGYGHVRYSKENLEKMQRLLGKGVNLPW